MIVENNVKCSTCGKIFCCLKCRCKHEQNTHGGISCPICHNNEIILRSSLNPKLITHIAEKHLPLRCVKCSKVYTSTSDILNISKCIENKAKFSNIITASLVAESSLNPSVLENKVTPTSMVKLQWKLKNKLSEHYIGDSLSSLKNISCINNSVPSRNENNAGTVVRSTSTPMQGAICCKQKETVFDSSGNHVSSIYASGSESEISPPIIVLTPVSPRPDIIADRLSKYHIGRSLNKKPVTPLRQVISNSIRRAITQHGMDNFKNENIKLKNSFDHSGSPLDLRTSPALRRVQSEIIEKSCSFDNFNSSRTSTRKSLSISSKKTTESVLIKSTTKSSVYTTCRSIAVITSTELQEVSVEKDINKISTSSSNSVSFTPKVGGIKKKKTIDFETPMHLNSVVDDDDVFYTPMSMFSSNCHENTSNAEYENSTENVEINICNEECKDTQNQSVTNSNNETTGGKKLWSMMTSIIQMPAFVKKHEQNDTSQSFIKRCASFAGYIAKTRNPSDDTNEQHSLKRRRNTDTDSIEAVAKRLKRIQGRKPINRMRNLSIENNLCKTKM